MSKTTTNQDLEVELDDVYEQEIADPEKRNDIRIIQSRDIGNGRTEVS